MGAVRRAAIIAVLACAGACGFSTRSGEFRCDPEGGCDDGRACIDGWCVAGAPAADADVRPFSCGDFGCVLECAAGECTEDLTCPAGRPCAIQCSGEGSCTGSIDCTAATSCSIGCTGDGSCRGRITCGGGPCDVDCAGPESCAQGVDCKAACACDLTCDGTGACAGTNRCPFNQCTAGNECVVSGGNNCDRC